MFYKVNFDGTDLAETDIGNPNWIETLGEAFYEHVLGV